jgi:hypothetical protein
MKQHTTMINLTLDHKNHLTIISKHRNSAAPGRLVTGA